MERIIDFHTHNLSGSARRDAIASYSLTEIEDCPPEQYFTVGLHPWDTALFSATPQILEKKLRDALLSPYAIGVGEVGLDRLRGAELHCQETLLGLQLEIAAELDLPVVVHCVRAWSELESVFRAVRFCGRKAIHGFRGKASVLTRLMNDGWYLSLGVRSGVTEAFLAQIPRNRLLLESDDTKEPLTGLYRQVATCMHCSGEELETLVAENIRCFFPKIDLR